MLKTISKKAVSNVLALSGGGTRGFAQLGALRVFDEQGIHFDAIAGTSVGSLIAVCYASGKSIEEIISHVMKLPFYKFLRPQWGAGLLRTENIVDEIISFIGVSTFEELSIPVFVQATDINTGEEISFSSGKLKPALCASIAVPGVFTPVKIGRKFYVDGGISRVIPFHVLPPAKNMYIVDIGFKFEKITTKSSSLQVVQNALFCLQKQTVLDMPSTAVYIEPDLDKFTFYEYSLAKRKKMLELGRLATKKALGK